MKQFKNGLMVLLSVSIWFMMFSQVVIADEKQQEQSKSDKQSVYVLEPTEVIGVPERDIMEKPMAESAGLDLSTTTIEQSKIQKIGAKTVIDALEYVPGALIETRGRKVKQFYSTRGQQYPYPDYALDGALFREFLETPYLYSSRDIEKIEVLRSAGAMLMGLTGLAGVINIVPREYTHREVSWEIEGGNFGTSRLHLSHGNKIKNVSYGIGLGMPTTKGPEGRHAEESMKSFFGNFHWKLSDVLSVKTNLYYVRGKRELAQAEPPAQTNLQTTLDEYDPYRTTAATVNLSYHPTSRLATDVTAFYGNRDHTYRILKYKSKATSPDSSYGEWDFERGINIIQSISLSKKNTLRFGGYYNRWIAPNGKRYYVGRSCDLETYTASIVDEHHFGKVILDGGLKWERTRIYEYGALGISDAALKSYKNVPNVKNKWDPGIVNGNVGLAYYITPSLSLNSNITMGTVKPRAGTLDINLQEPKDEFRVIADLGVRVVKEQRGEVSLVGFITNQKNAIVLADGDTATVNGNLIELYKNRDQKQIGLEFSAKSSPILNKVQLFLNASAMNSLMDVQGDMKENKELPKYIFSTGMFGLHKGFDFNLFWKYVSSYENARFSAEGPQSLGNYNVVNMTCGKSFGTQLRTRVYLEITNLFDKKFSTVVGYPDFGRRFDIGIREVL